MNGKIIKHLTTDDFQHCGAFVNYSGQVDSFYGTAWCLRNSNCVDIDKGYYWLEIQTQVIKRTLQIHLGATYNESSSGMKVS